MEILGKAPVKILLLMFFLMSFIFGSGCVRDFEEESGYNIRNMDISANHIGTAFVDLNITTYIEKYDGTANKNTSLLLKAYSKESGLLEAQNEVKLDLFKKGETKSVSQILSLPKTGGYTLQCTLFEENKSKSDGQIEIYNLNVLPADVHDIGLEISGMDFRVAEVENKKVRVESDIYLTNEGRETNPDFRMLVKVREMDAGLLADKIWTQTGEIKPETTVIRSINLTVPDQYNYIVEVLIWNKDTIVKRGEGFIQLNPQIRLEDKNTTESRQIQTDEFVNIVERQHLPEGSYSEEGEATPGFGLLLSVILIFSAAIFRRRLK
ncbi:MAG: DUF7490 domain-containing protein [Methanosarcina sp.]